MARTNVQTIGSNLRKMEQRSRQGKQTKRQQLLNGIATGVCLVLLGVMLGYGWKMAQESAATAAAAAIQAKASNSIAYDMTNVIPHKMSRKYLTGGTNSWKEEI